jgi:hypothetical protein
MGITVHYRGSIAEPNRLEEFEDRVVDVALELGASVQRWRSVDDNDPQRIVRGLILELSPGMESTSLLVAPEGWLIPLVEIEAAEQGALHEPPWCSVKTQFGGIDGHVALVELLAALQQSFFPGLEVTDEGGYWKNRDVKELSEKFSQLQRAIDGLAEGLRQTSLSREALEDPMIVAKRIERVALLVNRTLLASGRFSESLDDEDSNAQSGLR